MCSCAATDDSIDITNPMSTVDEANDVVSVVEKDRLAMTFIVHAGPFDKRMQMYSCIRIPSTDSEPETTPGSGMKMRYFIDAEDVICHTCGEPGHISKECPDKKDDKCYLCGEEGHRRQACPHGICYNCGNGGHQSLIAEKCAKKEEMDHVIVVIVLDITRMNVPILETILYIERTS